MLSAGQIADIDCAAKTIEHLPAQAVIADKGYDADHCVATIEAVAAQAVIPPRSHRLTPRACDRHLYGERHLLERTVLRAPQTLPPYRHALRQTGNVFLVAHSSGMRFRLAGLIESAL